MILVIVTLLMMLAVVPAANGRTFGVFEDTQGTDCNLSAIHFSTPVTWYVVYEPDASDAALQTIQVANLGINSSLFYVEAVPNPTAESVVGNPGNGSASMTFDCGANPTGPIVLWTLTVRNFGPVTPSEIRSLAFVQRCDSSPSFPVNGYSALNADRQPRPPVLLSPMDQAVNVPVPATLRWDGIQQIAECLPPILADVYFGLDPNPPFFSRTPAGQLTVGLSYLTTYYWRIDTVRLSDDLHFSSPVYSFTTGSAPPPPPPTPGCPSSCTGATECPSSCMYLSTSFFCEPGAKAEHVVTQACASPYYSDATGQMDLVAGTLRAGVDGCHESANGADVIAMDRFKIVGPPREEPLTLKAKLRCIGDGQGCIREGNLQACGFPTPFVPTTVEISLQHPVDEEFELEYKAGASAFLNDGGFCQVQLSFEELPSGYMVVSCHGFQSTVAVQPTTWSHVKSVYR